MIRKSDEALPRRFFVGFDGNRVRFALLQGVCAEIDEIPKNV